MICSVAPMRRGGPIASTQKCTHQFSTRSRYSSTIRSAPGRTKRGCATGVPTWWMVDVHPVSPAGGVVGADLKDPRLVDAKRRDILGTDRRALRRAFGTDDRREIGLVVEVPKQPRRHQARLGRHLLLVVDVLAQQPLAVGEHVAHEAVEVLARAVGADLAAHRNAGGGEQLQPARTRDARAADHRRVAGDRHDRAGVGVAEMRIGRVRTGLRQRQPRSEDGAGAEHRRALPWRGRCRRRAVAPAGVDLEIRGQAVTSGVNSHGMPPPGRRQHRAGVLRRQLIGSTAPTLDRTCVHEAQDRLNFSILARLPTVRGSTSNRDKYGQRSGESRKRRAFRAAASEPHAAAALRTRAAPTLPSRGRINRATPLAPSMPPRTRHPAI